MFLITSEMNIFLTNIKLVCVLWDKLDYEYVTLRLYRRLYGINFLHITINIRNLWENDVNAIYFHKILLSLLLIF